MQEATKDKPVIVLAISTDTPPAKAKDYMQNKGFTGPNILHGYEPKLAKSFGFENEFFNYAIVGPQGDLVASGNAGMAFMAGNGKKRFSQAAQGVREDQRLRQHPASSTPSMSAGLQEMLWPMELGYVAEVQRLLKKVAAEKTLCRT